MSNYPTWPPSPPEGPSPAWPPATWPVPAAPPVAWPPVAAPAPAPSVPPPTPPLPAPPLPVAPPPRGKRGLAIGTLAAGLLVVAAVAVWALAINNGKPTGSGPGAGGQKAQRALGRSLHLGFEIAGMSGQEQVSLEKLIDPAYAASPASPAPHYRFVGVDFTVRDLGPSPLLDDIDSDASLRGTDHRTYTPVYQAIQGCPGFDSGTYQLSSGGTATGCATFQLPAGVKVAMVVFTPLGGVTGSAPGHWELGR